jgi:hypothetical protein
VAPALHSLNICFRNDADRILKILFDSHVDIKKLILKKRDLGEKSTDILTAIVNMYPDLEALSLEDYSLITSTDYSLIPRLKKLSELNLKGFQVHYVYVKLLKTLVFIHEHM